jgi:predicted RecB family nuclease
LKKTSQRTLGFFTVPTGPTAAIHLKKDDFLSEEWGAPQPMFITSSIVQAYSLCPRKAFLFLYPDTTQSTDKPHAYVQILEERAKLNQARYIAEIRQHSGHLCPSDASLLSTGPDFLVNVSIRSSDLEAHCDVLTRVKTSSGLGRHSYEPTMVIGTYSPTPEQKLGLSFTGYVLGQVQNNLPSAGNLLNRGEQLRKILLTDSYASIKTILRALRGWIEGPPPEPPPVILNKHCPYCQFRNECTDLAIKEDNLSLLDRITPPLIKKYHKKGIFTVKQLSFLFRPRRRRKRPPLATFSPELQALAIRTNKIYFTQLQTFERSSVELFLDFEGIPDERFNYLAGLLIADGDSLTYQCFWADNKSREQTVWRDLVKALNRYPSAPIYHYGNYDARAVKSLSQRYGGAPRTLMNRLVNVNAWIYGKLYFPVRSNGLKDVGTFLGARWSSSDAFGLNALVWRHQWEDTCNSEYKQLVIRYNEEDCRALRAVVDAVSQLKNGLEVNPIIELADQPRRHSTAIGQVIHKQLDWIGRSAWADYDRNKLGFRPDSGMEAPKKKRGRREGQQAYIRRIPRTVGKVIKVRPRRKCPKHHEVILRKTGRITKQTVIDLVFTNTGCRKTTIRYEGEKGYCRKCNMNYIPRGIKQLRKQFFGRAFRSWVIYQRMVLRLPYLVILRVMEDMFSERMSPTTIVAFITTFVREYRATERLSIGRIMQSPFVHVDETRLNIEGAEYYVWIFTDGDHAVFRMTETREAKIVHEFLKGYQGVLITDFYSGYDSVPCRQQKCWVHLIRDLNDDLWANPFNPEFEAFVSDVRDLIMPICEAVEKHGLKKRHLSKFKKVVERFYRKTVYDRVYESEVARAYQKRFDRYRDNLFVFLEEDNIAWNNNMAERAMKELVVQRKISGSFHKRVAPDYLLLLGIAQSCKFQGKSFLKFLLSKERDLDAFRVDKRKKIAIAVGPPAAVGANRS